jgi:hypothetical protein
MQITTYALGQRAQRLLSLSLVVFVSASAACSHTLRKTTAAASAPPLTELWSNPADLEKRDLFTGPAYLGGAPAGRRFQFVAVDTTGASRGYDVKDDKGQEWSVKIGVEAQPEVVASRLLWAIGFHQPPSYYVRDWELTGSKDAKGPQPGARFRPSLRGYSVEGEWSWFENPFVDTVPYQGLIAANVLLNNWDFKTSNNKLYTRRDGTGAANGPAHLYVVRDLGASLGRSSQPALLRAPGFLRMKAGSKGDIDDFESQGYVTLGTDGRPDFDYKGSRRDLLDHVTVEGVTWACRLMSRISDKQYADAFRAANYPPNVTARYIKKIRQKIAEGMSLASR